MVRDLGLIDRLYTYRYLVGPDLVAEAEPGRSQRRPSHSSDKQFTAVVADPSRPRVLTQLPDLPRRSHVRQRETDASSMMSTGLAGLYAVILAVVLILAQCSWQNDNDQSTTS